MEVLVTILMTRHHTTVKKIIITVESVIHSITVEYDDDGSLVCSAQHGGLYGAQRARFLVSPLNLYITYITYSMIT